MKSRLHRIRLVPLARLRLCFPACLLAVVQSASAADGVWSTDGSGLWSATGNWTGGNVADGSGFTANFNTIDITSDRTVSLDGDRTLTNLIFGDTEIVNTPANWVLDNNGTSANNLILAGTNPTITVNALGTGKSATISAIIEGGAGLVKAGTGSLTLAKTNTFTGNVVHTTGGSIVLANSGAFGSGTKSVSINSPNVTLRLDGSLGNVSLPADTSFATAGLQTGGSIINVGGNNTINGAITLNSGASGTAFSVDAGTLTLANTVRITGSTVRTLTLRGSADGIISGVILNGGASLPVNKDSGAGTWTLSGANTYTGNTTVSAGTLKAGIASTTGPDSGSFGVNSSVTVNASGTLDITGFNTRINALIGAGTVTLGAANLTIGTANANSTFDGTISGTGGSLTKTGTGAQVLTGSSGYTGGTVVTNGDLVISNASALGSGTLTLANTASQIDCFGIEGGIDFANPIAIDLTAHRAGIFARTSGDNQLSGPVTISNSGPNNTVVIANNVASSTMTVSNTVSRATGGLVLSFRGSGAGSSGLVSNTLSLPADAAVDNNGVTNWTFSGTGSTWGFTNLASSGNIVLGAHNGLATTAVTGDGSGTGAIDLAGYNQTVAGLAGPAARIIGNSSTTSDSILSINATGQHSFAGVIADVFGPGSRKVSLILSGGGQTLAGANSYSGPTTINAGTLTVSGSLANTAVEVKSGAALAGTGSIGGNVTVRSGGHQAFDVAASTGGQLTRTISGSLTLDAGNVIDLTAAAPPAVGGPYVLITATGGITGTPGTVNLNGLNGTVIKNGNNLELTVTAASGFTSWIANFPVTDATPSGDSDKDGMLNLLEFVLNGNPAISDPVILPDLNLTATQFEFTFSRRDDSIAPETIQTFQYGSDLAGWTNITLPSVSGTVGAATITVIDGTPADTITVKIPKAVVGGNRIFGRLKVEKP